jgi:protein arginine N-methyltransferase 1
LSGILIDENDKKTERTSHFNAGFENANVHIRMLNDVERTTLYINAIQKTIRPTDVVVEIGTGTGVLAIAAAKAGAKKVYAIEAGKKMAQLAKANFKANQVDDKITLIEGWSTQVNIPEKATVLISEIIGNHPLDEDILKYTKDAQKRFLTKNARMLPSHLKLMVSPVQIPLELWSQHHFTAENVKKWEECYQINFSGLLTQDAGNSLRTFKIIKSAAKASKFLTLTKPCQIADIDLLKIQSDYSEHYTLNAVANGILNGVIVFCDIKLAEGIILSTNPKTAKEGFHWSTHIELMEKPINLQTGDRFTLEYKHNKGIETKKMG